MPELPEVEVVRRQLSAVLKDKPVIEAFCFYRKDLRDVMPQRELQKLVGAQINSVQRRAKYLLIETSKGGILSHLGMTGQWRVLNAKDSLVFENAKSVVRGVHDHLRVILSTGESLVYRDPRRFGIFETYNPSLPENQNARLAHLGPEPLFEDQFDDVYLQQKLKGRAGPIKSVIMDQKLVVGVGNIYASEALFHAGIHPLLSAKKLVAKNRQQSLQALVLSIRKVLREAIGKGGSTIADFKSMSGDQGGFQNFHFVYAREGESCLKCKTKIKSCVVAGRSTFWCPTCQKK